MPLSKPLAQALFQARRSADGSALVFASADGLPLDSAQPYRVVKAAGKRAGVPWVGLHTLRHTCATLAFKSGWNAKQVQALLGHHSAAFTLTTYVHLLPDDLPEPTFLDGLPVDDGEGNALDDDRGVDGNAAPADARSARSAAHAP